MAIRFTSQDFALYYKRVIITITLGCFNTEIIYGDGIYSSILRICGCMNIRSKRCLFCVILIIRIYAAI